nr:thioester domain-containing protein [uncultured Schaedlerella sp.]
MTFDKMKTRLAAFGLALVMGLVPAGNLPAVHAAGELSSQQEHVTQENAKQENQQEPTQAQRRVTAKDLVKKVKDQTFSIGTSLEGIVFDPEKDEVSFYKAIGDEGSEYQSYRAGSYTASYLVTPKDQGDCYVVTRKIILTDTEGSAHVSDNGGEKQKTDTDPEDGADPKDGIETKKDAGSDLDSSSKEDDELNPDSGSKKEDESEADSDSKKGDEKDPDSSSKKEDESDADSGSKKEDGSDADSDSKKEDQTDPDSGSKKDLDEKADPDKDSKPEDQPENKPQDTGNGKITFSGGKGDTEESLSRLLKDIAEGKLLIVSAAGNTSGVADSTVHVEKWEEIQSPVSLGDPKTSLFQINGETAYCLEAQDSKPFTVDAVSSMLESNETLQKVLYYGYGGEGDLTGECLSGKSKEEKYVYTQIAASCAYEGQDEAAGYLPEELQDTEVAAYVEFLLGQEALPGNDLSFSVSNQSGSQNQNISIDAAQDGELQKTPEIKLLGDSRNDIELSLPGDVTCYNVTKDSTITDGTIKIYGGDSFYLSADRQVTGSYDSGELSGSHKDHWEMLFLASREGKADTGVFAPQPAEPVRLTVNWLRQAEIRLLKKDRDTGLALAGAVYGIYQDPAGKDLLMELPETGENGNTVSESIDRGLGQVYVKEIKAPEKYLLDSNVYPVDVEQEETVELTVYDVREQDGQEEPITETQISKVDAVTGELLEGAVLQVLDPEGNLKEEWTSTKEAHVIRGLREGEYTLHEEMAPYQEGYVSASDLTFQVSKESIAKVEMKDGYSRIDLSVQDQTTGKELSDAVLQIVDQNGTVLKEWEADGKPYRVEKLPVNEELTLRETAAPKGYVIPKEIKFLVMDTEEVQSIEMKNARGSEKASKPGTSGSDQTTAPKTGDAMHLPMVLLVASLLSFTLLVVLLLRRRRR